MHEEAVIHGSCIAIGGDGVLLLGAPGSGKSDLALRLIDGTGTGLTGTPRTGQLVADDQVVIHRSGERLMASAPPALRGQLEIRGLGIVSVAAAPETALKLAVRLTPSPRSSACRIWKGARWTSSASPFPWCWWTLPAPPPPPASGRRSIISAAADGILHRTRFAGIVRQLLAARARSVFAIMIGLVLVTHGRLAEEFLFALEHIVGPQSGIETIAIGPEDRMENRRADIAAAITRVDNGSGVIILTDMFGGTPSNLAISLLEIGKVEVVAGLNLPMLVKLARIRKDYALDKAATTAQDAGRKYINVASQILGD